MSDRPFTLIDVMKGIHNLSLYNKIPAPQFRFLIGLICKANSLGFKPIMEITNNDAICLGGGNSRQSVNRLRKGLEEFELDGDPILVVTHGSHFKNISAKYEINFKALCQNGNAWYPSPSQKNDGSDGANTNPSQKNDGEGAPSCNNRHANATDPVTTPRSDQKRLEEKEEVTISNVVSEREAENFGMMLRGLRTNCCNPNISEHMEILQRISTEKKRDLAIELAKTSQDKGIEHWNFMKWLDTQLGAI